ncbi:MAG: hypothetical protein MJ025_05810 [Victivallaceae bacterium]|nr:hypothetical protein [Victivallaceae bacterium]
MDDLSNVNEMFIQLELRVKIAAAKLQHRFTKQLYYIPEAKRVKREKKLSYDDISKATGIPVGRLEEIFNSRGKIAELDELDILREKLGFTLEKPFDILCKIGVGIL